MRTVNYRLSDGTMTSSFEIAKASGMSFTTHLEEVRTPRVPMSAARKTKIEEFFARKRKQTSRPTSVGFFILSLPRTYVAAGIFVNRQSTQIFRANFVHFASCHLSRNVLY